MTPEPHRIPGELFDAMAAGAGGAEGLRLLARAEHSRRLVCVHAVTAAARDIGGAVADEAQRAWELLATARARAPEAAAAVLTHPAAGPALVGLLVGLDRVRAGGPAAARPEHRELPWPRTVSGPADLPMSWFTALAAAVAVRAGLPGQVRWAAPGPWVTLPSLGRAHFHGARPGHTVELTVGAEGHAGLTLTGGRPAQDPVVVPGERYGAHGRWQGAQVLAELAPGTPLLLDTIDPPCFPGAVGGPLALGTDELNRWQATARDAVRLLRAEHPLLHAELAAGPRVLVPLPGGGRGNVSGSSAETFGCVALSRPRSATGLAVTLAHELQHNKFAALLHLFDLFEPGGTELYYAAWRPDPRPLFGLFHGAYAHLGVAQFWSRRRQTARDPGARAAADVQFARWRSAAREATRSVLGSGRLTPLGRRFADGMLDTLDDLCRLPVPAEARRRASASARRHRSTWSGRYGTAPVRVQDGPSPPVPSRA
ncbi:HEXXH motif-containing putative peptide modification protein [Streptomyces sp. VRA16 Mangrove soil]|uniref:aKG-HExxH-type peptide beta-hydroxylase n=1 Tax=Streptomyces sp. VRA16 Mangrove soil TaxID=2817434 RepID=UPI001A9E6D05|nr:HEXXH motif-containing putative peptide modification protein [Streptomyces sp. VRA16 Mangrove soil]MBO1330024.1 HEXXH motif domain-containing protein [Streptomyces sp. VRA16 Mangrove soil]